MPASILNRIVAKKREELAGGASRYAAVRLAGRYCRPDAATGFRRRFAR